MDLMRCPRCATLIPVESRFCRRCGCAVTTGRVHYQAPPVVPPPTPVRVHTQTPPRPAPPPKTSSGCGGWVVFVMILIIVGMARNWSQKRHTPIQKPVPMRVKPAYPPKSDTQPPKPTPDPQPLGPYKR